MPATMTARPNEDRTGRTVHKLTVNAIAAIRKISGGQGYPQTRNGRTRSGSFQRRRIAAIAVNAKKIQSAKTNSEYSSSNVPLSASNTPTLPRNNNDPLGVRNVG